MEDHRLGRMSRPVHAQKINLSQARLVPRFGVEQGLKPDGTAKIRAVDNLSWSAAAGRSRKRSRGQMKEDSVNGSCTLPGKVSHDHLDSLLVLLRLVFEMTGVVPWLWKADVDAAFRRVPLLGAHVWAAGVAYLLDGVAWCSFHYATPFGATSSVWAWHRIGAMLEYLARKLLHIPVLRYVDDYFSAERRELVEHAMRCFARSVSTLFASMLCFSRRLCLCQARSRSAWGVEYCRQEAGLWR